MTTPATPTASRWSATISPSTPSCPRWPSDSPSTSSRSPPEPAPTSRPSPTASRRARPVSPPPCANWRPTATCAVPANAPTAAGSSPAPSPATSRAGSRNATDDAPEHAPEPSAGPPARRAAEQRKKPPRRALPAVPQPGYTSPALLQAATDVLAGLRREDPRLLLSATDAEHLAPGVAAWLERDLTPTAVRHALTSDLPAEPLYRPAALLAHRLTDRLPPLPPWRAPAEPAPVQYRVRNCDGCDRGFHSPGPGARCRDCRERQPLAVTTF